MKFVLLLIILVTVSRACGDRQTPNFKPRSQHSTHIVRSGDSLLILKRLYSLSDDDITFVAITNKLRNPNIIHPGQILVLPIAQEPLSDVQTSAPTSVPSALSQLIALAGGVYLVLRNRKKHFAKTFKWRESSYKTTEEPKTNQYKKEEKKRNPVNNTSSPNRYDYCLKVLELNRHYSEQELKSAYKRKALVFHPDRNKSSSSDKFHEISFAYNYLKNRRAAA